MDNVSSYDTMDITNDQNSINNVSTFYDSHRNRGVSEVFSVSWHRSVYPAWLPWQPAYWPVTSRPLGEAVTHQR